MAERVTPSSSSPPADTLFGELVSGLLLRIDMHTGEVFDPGAGLRSFLGLAEDAALPRARSLFRRLTTSKVLFGALRATRFMPGKSQQVILKFTTTQQGPERHAKVRVRWDEDTGLYLYLEEFTEQRDQNISQAVMSAGLEHGTNEFYVLDSKLRIVHANGAALENTGYAAHELLGEPGWILAQDLKDREFLESQQAQLRSSRTTAISYSHRRKDGSEYLFEHSTTEVKQFGQFWYVAIGQDVTDSIQQQVALRESEERLATAINSGQVAICDYRPADNFLYLSESGLRWLGETATPDNKDVRAWIRSRIHEDDLDSILGQLVQSSGPRPLDVELRAMHAQGHIRRLRFQGRAICEAGAIERISGTLTDVTAERLAQEERDRAASNLRALLESVDEAILSLDQAGRILEWNPAAKALLHGKVQLGESIGDLFETPINLTAAAEGGSLHTRLKDAHNPTRGHVELRVNPVERDSGPGFTVVILDTSARVLREQALRAAADDAAAAAKAKSEFLATMSHEIRTPMNGVLGMAQVLMDTTLDEEQRQALDIMVRSGTALLDVINDVLDFSRLEAGKLTVKNAPFEPAEVARDVHQLLWQQAKEKQLDLQLRLPPLPGRYEGDATRLRQIMINLVGNAIKFTDHGSVTTELLCTGQGIEIVVKDTGIGIKEADLEKLFVPFAQADGSSTRRFGGSGLGLAISHRLAVQMNGTITAVSNPGAGSTFRCTLGLKALALQERPAPKQQHVEKSPSSAGPTRFERRRILVAEDNPVNQKVAARLLERLGCNVTIATDGAAAVRSWQEHAFDLIFMDCQMPTMDGFAATRRIRELEQQETKTPIPIIAMTANVMEADRQACFRAGMNDHAPKPVVRELLVSKLEQWLSAESTADGGLTPPPAGGICT